MKFARTKPIPGNFRKRCESAGHPVSFSLFVLCILSFIGCAPLLHAELEPSQVLILVNKDTGISDDVARMYQKARGIPPENVLKLSLGDDRQITLEQYNSQMAIPVRKFLESHLDIRCIVTTSGVPYTLKTPAEEGGAVDNELAMVLRDDDPKSRKSRQPNPFYLYGMNSYGVTDPRAMKMVFVARLDGPGLKVITRMVQDAVAVEKTGLQGPVFGDARGVDGAMGQGRADASIRATMDILSGAGFQSTLDLKEESWMQPKGGVGNQAAGAAFYIGWYNLLNFQDIFGQQGLARGAIAWHIASQEAQDIWSPKEPGWCINLLLRGAAVTLGPVREPYVQAFPDGDVFVERLLTGGTVAESYWLSLPQTSWQMVLLGDPLYRPFAAQPRATLVARAYVVTDPPHVLEANKTTNLLVQVECIGPAGASCPSLSTTAEPELGLTAASGAVPIPALKAGEVAAVSVPSVTAGGNSTGIFRLRLKAQAGTENSRDIVLEGRIGFSRLTAGVLPKTQMFVSPNGEHIISGEPGGSVLVQRDTLETLRVNTPKGVGLVGAEFSKDSAYVALALLDPEEKKGGVLIADSHLGSVKQLPPGSRFMRWLDNERILLRDSDGLVSHKISGGDDRKFAVPAGWSGTVIPGTDIEILASKDGKMAVQKGADSPRDILENVKDVHFGAVADDLSLFGGVDDQKRLWIQKGFSAAPEVIASGVERVVWRPISRRAIVEEAGGKSRVYDGRDGSWIDLGVISGAVWSANEQRLLFITGGNDPDLALMIDGHIQPLCSMFRIGAMQGAVFSADGQEAFLLAGIGGRPDVWMIALPGPTANEMNVLPFNSQKRFIVTH